MWCLPNVDTARWVHPCASLAATVGQIVPCLFVTETGWAAPPAPVLENGRRTRPCGVGGTCVRRDFSRARARCGNGIARRRAVHGEAPGPQAPRNKTDTSSGDRGRR